MAVGFQHPKVKVHIGDGFKFLDDYKNEFDVIITDSSDPEGPAESLFQKPYFELLFGALKEGGVITTQGCTFSYISVDLVISLYITFFEFPLLLRLRSSCFPASFIFNHGVLLRFLLEAFGIKREVSGCFAGLLFSFSLSHE